MTGDERAYHLMLRAYPPAFRAEYAQEMMQAFRDSRRDCAGSMQFWLWMCSDTARSAPALRWEALCARWKYDTYSNGGIMKTMAILAVLIGVVVALNASIEGWAGGVMNHDSASLLAGALGVLAGVGVLAAGVALLRGARSAMILAQVAAVVCFVVFAITLVTSPRFSIFADMLGIGFPVLLFLFVRLSSGRGMPSARTT